jgi:hypothetical protein
MTSLSSALFRDANRVPLQDINGVLVQKDLTFANTSTAQTLFTVTGDVILRIIAVCKTNLASAAAANVEVGVTGTTGKFIATTVATAVDANEIWHDATPDASIELDSVAPSYIVSNGQDIILTPSAQVDSGAITFYCQWRPLSTNANVI